MVTRGMIVEKDGDHEVKAPRFKHKTGDILGLQYLHPSFNQIAFANAYCHHSSDAVCIPIEISKIQKNLNKESMSNFWKAVAPRLIKLKHLEFSKISHWTRHNII